MTQCLINIAVLLATAKLFAILADRCRQPRVLGELIGGVLLGFFSFFHPNDPVLSHLAEAGVILLLFRTGLESDLHQLLRVGPVSFRVASVGVCVPFVLGYSVMELLGHHGVEAVVVGAAMTATSIGISVRVLADLGQLRHLEGQIILGAAVIDDIMGVLILAAVQGLSNGGALSWQSMIDSALIVGSFSAGLGLATTRRRAVIHKSIKPLAAVLIPVFFVMVGAKVDLHPFNPLHPANWGLIGIAVLLVLVAVIGKLASGWAARLPGLNRLAIGVGMIPRGEVGLIFAQIGLSSGMIGMPLYTALIGMVVATTFITPFWLKSVISDRS